MQGLGHIGFAPTHGVCPFPVDTAQTSACSDRELSKAGPGKCSPSTWSPELLGSGKGPTCRPNQVCAFVEYPSSLDLGNARNSGLEPSVSLEETHPLPPRKSSSWDQGGKMHHTWGDCVSSGELDLWLRPSRQMSTVQNPRESWLGTGSLLVVW